MLTFYILQHVHTVGSEMNVESWLELFFCTSVCYLRPYGEFNRCGSTFGHAGDLAELELHESMQPQYKWSYG